MGMECHSAADGVADAVPAEGGCIDRFWIVRYKHYPGKAGLERGEVEMRNPTEQAYEELRTAFEFFNRELFGGRLPVCLITLQRRRNCYGFFARRQFVDTRGETTDELAVNPAFFMVVPLAEILQTMAHEQAHLWQAHFGKPGRRGYHNRQWARKMFSTRF